MCGALGLVALAFAPASTQAFQKIVVTGSSTVAPLVSEIGKRFEKQHPGVRVDVQMGGSSRGIADARGGLSDIGMTSRALKPEESDLSGRPVAYDGICLIVNKANRVPSLTKDQVISVYTGKIKNWKEAGGADAPIVVVNKAEGRATLELFLHYFGLKSPEIQASVIIGDNQQGIKTVAGNPHAIGYVSVGAAEYDAERGAAIRLLPMDGVEASLANVGNGRFPIRRPLTLITRNKPMGLIKEFLDYATSRNVEDIIRQQYFVPPRRD